MPSRKLYYLKNHLTDEDIYVSIDGAHVKTGNTVHFDIWSFLKENGCIKALFVLRVNPVGENTVLRLVDYWGSEEDFAKIGGTIDKLLKQYFDEIIEMLKWGKFDVLAHLTYPLRYFYSKSNLDIDLDKFKDQIDEILTLAAKKGKALEINTAALRQPLNKLSPEVDIIKRFKELGGKYVSVGSDAHYAEHLSADIDMAYSAALEAGFDSITFFQKRTPMEMKIEMED